MMEILCRNCSIHPGWPVLNCRGHSGPADNVIGREVLAVPEGFARGLPQADKTVQWTVLNGRTPRAQARRGEYRRHRHFARSNMQRKFATRAGRNGGAGGMSRKSNRRQAIARRMPERKRGPGIPLGEEFAEIGSGGAGGIARNMRKRIFLVLASLGSLTSFAPKIACRQFCRTGVRPPLRHSH